MPWIPPSRICFPSSGQMPTPMFPLN
jgi:hypothetical protein